MHLWRLLYSLSSIYLSNKYLREEIKWHSKRLTSGTLGRLLYRVGDAGLIAAAAALLSGVHDLNPVRLWLPYPPSANRLWRAVPRCGILLSKVGRLYRRHAVAAALAGDLDLDPDGAPFYVDGVRLALRVDAFPPDRRSRRDLDNIPKAVQDALGAAGLWSDDSQIDHLTVIRRPVARAKGCKLAGAVHVTVGPTSSTDPTQLEAAPEPAPATLAALLALKPPEKARKPRR